MFNKVMEQIEIGKLILIVIGIVLAIVGVIMIFDARIITKRLFSFGDQNEGVLGLKIVGFVITIIGGIIVFFN